LTLAAAVGREGIPSTVSFDLSHVGSVVDRELGFRHAREIAEATAPLGAAMMISAEGSDRTDLVLDLYEALAAEHPHVGITLQARLYRTGLLDRLHGEGYRTREYVIFGGEWWLYVLNRIAEQPERVLTAIADMNHLIMRRARG
jgi:proline dehydrogenase